MGFILALTIAALATPTSELPEPGAGLSLDQVRAIPVQHDGRWPPLDTLARDVVEKVTGSMHFQGHDPAGLLLAWTFEPEKWEQAPLISISNAELRAELELSQDKTEFSYAELVAHERLLSLIRELAHIGRGQKPDPLQSKVSDINGKLVMLQDVFGNQVIRPVPHPDDLLGTWQPIPPLAAGATAAPDSVEGSWADLKAAFVANDAGKFGSASERLAAALAVLPAGHRPAAKLIATELRYNRLRPFRTAWKVMVLGAVLSALAVGVRRTWFDVIAIMGLLGGFAVLTYGLSLRWQIAGRIPAANMFESLLFLSWGMGAFAVVSMFLLRHRVVPLTASVMGAVALMLADLLPLDHFVRPIVPVLLDTIWMSIHVPIIMVSYSVLALAVLIAHGQLVVMAAVPRNHRLAEAVDVLHYWYVVAGSILLLAGIVTGSMWAASSWGRYWGWDPKEVWSLVAFLGYMAILHVRVDRDRVPIWAYVIAALLALGVFVIVVARLSPMNFTKGAALAAAAAAMAFFVLARSPFATAVKSVVAFWLIIMTYLGVNYVLGTGLHSYGFGTGAVVRYMFLVGSIDLGLIIICYLVYLLRSHLSSPGATEPLAAGPPG